MLALEKTGRPSSATFPPPSLAFTDMIMVPPARLERATYGLGIRCSILLSYGGSEKEQTMVKFFYKYATFYGYCKESLFFTECLLYSSK